MADQPRNELFLCIAVGIALERWLPAPFQTIGRDDALANLYRHLPKGKTVYIYCHDGFRMSLAYMQLKHLGVKDVRLYNGGWSHWGNS
jgi:3-mercaptopyruvate sulfurtransferase SseA